MRYYLITLSLLCALNFSCKNADKKVAKPNDPDEELAVTSTFEDLNGNPISLDDYKGKRVLLNFWATWCKPCIEEMPSLLEAEALLKDENYIFLLASDQSVEKTKKFIEKKGYDFNYLKYNGTLSDLQIYALPATFIYNEKGEISSRIIGANEWTAPDMIDTLKAVK